MRTCDAEGGSDARGCVRAVKAGRDRYNTHLFRPRLPARRAASSSLSRSVCAGRAMEGEEKTELARVGVWNEEETYNTLHPTIRRLRPLARRPRVRIHHRRGAARPPIPSVHHPRARARAPHLRHRNRLPTRASVRRRRAVHALVERLRHGPVVGIVVRSTWRVGVVAGTVPRARGSCVGGVVRLTGHLACWKSAVLAA
jgi:hypothetical protein